MGKLNGFWTGLDWDNWLYGLIKGFIGGGATSVYAAFGTMIVDPKDFAFGSSKSFQVMGWVFFFSALMSTFAFLSKSALPEMKKREETIQVSQKGDQPPVITKTTKDILTVPIDAPPTPPPQEPKP